MTSFADGEEVFVSRPESVEKRRAEVKIGNSEIGSFSIVALPVSFAEELAREEEVCLKMGDCYLFASYLRFLLHESQNRVNNSPPKFRVAWFRRCSGLLVCPVLCDHRISDLSRCYGA